MTVNKASKLRPSLASKLPYEVNNVVRRLTMASLIGQSVLVVSGGAVRLTASGLGCPTWPRCTAGSFVNTPEMGIHGIIEFSNRTLTFLLAFIALALLVFLWNLRKQRKDLFWLSFGLLASIPAQAVIGGITVLTHLNPWVVGLHFLVSAALIIFSMLLVNRSYGRSGRTAPPLTRPISKTTRQLSILALWCTIAAVVLGTMVTGSGPHAGDANAPRNNLDPDLITRIHVLPVYILVLTAIILVVTLWRRGAQDKLRNASLLLLIAVVVQAAIGYTQHFTGLPPLVVGMHMAGAAFMLATATNQADLARRR
ncbi:MAG: heme A synthase [Acidobacteria bacterium]|nr:heme A synthase [Acidobacteriota bacterium]